MPIGVILKGIGGFYYVKTAVGVFECKARGIFRKNVITPLPGDRVDINIISNEPPIGNIEDIILPRTSLLARPAVANVDRVLVTIAVKSPQPDLILVDKILITAAVKGISACLCVNKIDLDENNSFITFIEKAYKPVVDKVFPLTKSNKVLYDELLCDMSSKINVFAGQSGAGKSTILNKILNDDIMETGIVSAKIGRGKHTTRHAELIGLKNGGYIVDTPGFSSFEMDNMEPTDLQLYYPEFEDYNNNCRFSGCSHVNEPGCAVKDALSIGIIDLGRYERYKLLYAQQLEIKNNKYR